MKKIIVFIMALMLGVLTTACGGQAAVSVDEPIESSSEEASSLPEVSKQEEERISMPEPEESSEPEAVSEPIPESASEAAPADPGPRIQVEEFYSEDEDDPDSTILMVSLIPDAGPEIGRFDLAADKARELMTAIDFDRLVYTAEMYDMDIEVGFKPYGGVVDGYVPDPAIIFNGHFFEYTLRLDKNSGIAMYQVKEGEQTHFYTIPEGFYESVWQVALGYRQYDQMPVWVDEGDDDN